MKTTRLITFFALALAAGATVGQTPPAPAAAASMGKPAVCALPATPPTATDGRPLITKLGTIGVDLCETSPFVFNDRLYRLEWHRKANRLRIIDHDTREEIVHFAEGHAFPCILVEGGIAYVVATVNDHKQGNYRQTLHFFSSKDLKNWDQKEIFHSDKMGRICNTTMCKADDRFVLSVESSETGAWGSRFMETRDLKSWTMLPKEYHGGKPGRLYSPHLLRFHDGWFYLFATVGGQRPTSGCYGGYVMVLHRSRDLKTWEASPFNPVLNGSDDDKKIFNPDITEAFRADIAKNAIRNNSDMDFIPWKGRLCINYCWGTQGGAGHEYVAEAEYAGSEAQFLTGWFPAKAPAPAKAN